LTHHVNHTTLIHIKEAEADTGELPRRVGVVVPDADEELFKVELAVVVLVEEGQDPIGVLGALYRVVPVALYKSVVLVSRLQSLAGAAQGQHAYL
jgi:hypothetical protein